MEIQNLTDEEINALVAEALGWRTIDVPSDWIKGLMLKWYYEPGSSVRRGSPPPEYATSLDACATFEATIADEKDQERYSDEVVISLNEDIRGERRYLALPAFTRITATPRQRCIAFLRTKGVL